MVPPDSRRISPVPRYSGYCSAIIDYVYGALTLYSPASHAVLLIAYVTTSQSYNPDPAVTGSVRANPRSLATTCGITVVFSSYAYLDVSVQRVRLPYKRYAMPSAWRVAPFGNPRINSYVPIPAACRSLSRPSSTLGAWASPVCPYLLSSIHCPFCQAMDCLQSIYGRNHLKTSSVLFVCLLFYTNMSKNSFRKT